MLCANADPVNIDGIYYNLIKKGNIAEVTSNPNKYSGKVVIPSTVTYEGVKYDVTSIGANAFQGCSMTSITIGNGVTSIGNYALSYCKGLTSITIPNSVTSIGKNVFEGCSDLISITFGSGLTSIGKNAFYDCKGLTSVHISDIAAWCNISFGDNPLDYAHHLYLNDEEIKDLVIPNSVTYIGKETFYACSGLTSVTIPNSVIFIDDYAFFNCSGLTSITIPNSVTSIGKGAFSDCNAVTSLTIGNGVTSIGKYAFLDCDGLSSVIIPNNVETIGEGAFANLNRLTSITIGSGVTNIGEKSFAWCPELTDVYCYAKNVPDTYYNAFEGSYIEYVTLHVPKGCIDAYKSYAFEPWKSFKTIVEDGGTGINDIKDSATTKPFDVYDLSGRKVLTHVTSLDVLPNGVYIINGKKTLKK